LFVYNKDMELSGWAKAVKDFVTKYDRRIGLAFLIGGFIFDNLTLQRVDFFLDNLVLLSYLAVVALSIAIINVWKGKLAYAAPYVMQFAFGGLFSGFIVFYSRSASLVVSWPFLLFLAAFFIGNEFLRKRYEALIFHLSVFFVAVFSYTIFSLPVLFQRLGVGVFLFSGLISLTLVAGFIFALKKAAPEAVAAHFKSLIGTIAAVYAVFNVFYFTNIIPPIPLALKEAGIYHSIGRLYGGDYYVLAEKKAWHQFFTRNDISLRPGEPAYAYSAVFAPTKLTGKIFHRWSYYDQVRERWIEVGRIGFPIVGGRDGGYRGYSVKENVLPGRWRVDVITERDQIIGRINFNVKETVVLSPAEWLVR